MPSVLRSIAVFSFVSAIAVISAPGCSQQGEGERCDSTKNGDADCDDGLVCIKKGELVEGITDRCCPSDPNSFSDSRCTRGTRTDNTGGTSAGGTSAGGTAGSSGSSVGGAGAAGEAAGGTTNTAGASPSSDGGMSGAGGVPSTTDGGAAGAGTAGQGGAG